MQTSLDSQSVSLPRMPLRDTTCAGATPVTLDDVTHPAMVWAKMRGLKWSTVKMRRMRGYSWRHALEAGRRKSPWMDNWVPVNEAQLRRIDKEHEHREARRNPFQR